MKNSWIWILVVVVVIGLVGGYLGRHKIKSFLGMTPTPPPVVQTTSSAASATPSTSASDVISTKTDPKKGDYLADSKGMTLYIFDRDTAGVSNCSGSCATIWPPYLVGSTAPSTLPVNLTTIKRADGSMQYAYKDKPLYYYSKDSKAGDTNGDGVGGIWHLVKP